MTRAPGSNEAHSAPWGLPLCLAFIAGLSGCEGAVVSRGPAFARDNLCGDGIAGIRESCDGNDTRGATCRTLGFEGGALRCEADCSALDTTGCLGAQRLCGNDRIDGHEVCDGVDLDGEDCLSRGYPGGTLACNATCSAFTTTDCFTADCPDLILGSELSDPGDLRPVATGTTNDAGDDLLGSCGDPDGWGDDVAYAWTAPATGAYRIFTAASDFNPLIFVLDRSCRGPELTCNDDTAGVEPAVQVDLVAGQTVVVVVDTLDYPSGEFNLYITQLNCGDGIAEGTEICDGNDLRGADCTDLGYDDGILGCAPGCLFYDVSLCSGGGDCCEVTPGVAGCQQIDIATCVCGTHPACCTGEWSAGCVVAVNDLGCGVCETDPVCGDGTAEGFEVCDGDDLRGMICEDMGFTGGNLRCEADCTDFVTSACTTFVQSDCCAPTPGVGGCLNVEIESCICTWDPYCCDIEWDSVCVDGVAAAGCGVCGGPICGDGTAALPEICDGGDLAGVICEDLGYAGGSLACADSCFGYETDACTIGGDLCCQATPGLGGCEDPEIETCVCTRDSFCCQYEWDDNCVTEVSVFDCGSCAGLPVCGNDVAEETEFCDGPDLRGFDCVDFGFTGGSLACASNCLGFVISACTDTGPVCGNNQAENSEICDGVDLRGLDCTDLGFWGGSLRCRPDCAGYDTSECGVDIYCGDGLIEPPELCDSFDLGGFDCTDLGFDGGLLACTPDCAAFDTSMCTNGGQGNCCQTTPGVAGCSNPGIQDCVCASDPYCCDIEWDDLCIDDVESFNCGQCAAEQCGNGIAEGTEFCDGADVRGILCTDLGFEEGILSCAESCTGFDTSECTGGSGDCGNGIADGLELCDGEDLRGFSCELLGFGGGSLWCDPGCFGFDTSDCNGDGPFCGDNIAEGFEMCDGTDLRGYTCDWLGLGGGELACLPSCFDFDTSGCEENPVCGNGVAEAWEMCDEPDLREMTCQWLGFSGGELRCTADCFDFDTSDCEGMEPFCGNNFAEDPELCDGWDVREVTCEALGYEGGWLFCDPSCFGYDTSWCTTGNEECGNELAEGNEACDGTDLRGLTCVDFGLPEGDLLCMPDCSYFDFIGCEGNPECPEEDLGSATGAPVITGTNQNQGNEMWGTCVGGSGQDVSYSWTAPETGLFVINTVGSNFDTGLYARATCSGPELACNDDTPGLGLQSEIGVFLEAGEQIIIVIDAWGSGTGAYSLNINASSCGNGVAEANEVCDGADLLGVTCVALGYEGGILGCTPNCQGWDISGCEGGGSGDCCISAPMPGCNNDLIEGCVCSFDPYCCTTMWDDICVGEVVSSGCGTCGGEPGDCCTPTPGSPGCDYPEIQECVCNRDDYCCDVEWDNRCVRYVGSLGCGVCE